MESWISRIADDPFFKQIDIAQQLENLNLSYGSLLQQFLSGLSTSLGSIVSTIASATMIIVTVPFILFYMLKDGEKLVPNLKTVFPERRRDQIVGLLGDLNKTLSNYISGQAIECIFVATFTFIGYWMIGVNYAFLFGVIAGVTNLIPYLGPYLGLIPAVLVTVFDEPFSRIIMLYRGSGRPTIRRKCYLPECNRKIIGDPSVNDHFGLISCWKSSWLAGDFPRCVPFYAICRTIVVFIVRLIKDDKIKKNQERLIE